MTRAAIGFVLGLGLLGCAALKDSMQHAEDAYDRARYDDALVWLGALQEDTADMEPGMRARYYFLRGMTDYRLGRRDDALYHLAVAREVGGESGRGLRAEWRTNLEATLEELTPEAPTHHAPERADGE